MVLLEEASSEKQRQIENLKSENEQLRNEVRQNKPTKEITIGQPPEKMKTIETKFDQLVKEVDQCFGELGRQMQRETKARQEIEQKLNSTKSEPDLDLDIKIRIEKVENALKETQKVIHAPSFKLLSQATKISVGIR